MDKYYVIVAGAGSTSRANVEALIDDYVYANGQDVTFILAYETQPAPGQVFISQWAKDKNKDILVFSNEGAKFDGIYSASVSETNNNTTRQLNCKCLQDLSEFERVNS